MGIAFVPIIFQGVNIFYQNTGEAMQVLATSMLNTSCVLLDRRLSGTLLWSLGLHRSADGGFTGWSIISDFIGASSSTQRSAYQFYQQHWSVCTIIAIETTDRNYCFSIHQSWCCHISRVTENIQCFFQAVVQSSLFSSL